MTPPFALDWSVPGAVVLTMPRDVAWLLGTLLVIGIGNVCITALRPCHWVSDYIGAAVTRRFGRK